MRISDWSSDVCSSDLGALIRAGLAVPPRDLELMHRGMIEAGIARRFGDGGADASAIARPAIARPARRSEEHTSELQSLMRISYAVVCLKKKTNKRHCIDTTLEIYIPLPYNIKPQHALV